ncbi:MAG: hypothetical protein JNK74_06935 [Candidatus Hydrogenedentes bacterium]|nr:hypothetical protein [Candidatus Hydrogenedentota bacterium]
MKKSLVLGLALLVGGTAQAAVIDFEEFGIRGGGTATELLGQNGVSFNTPSTGDKAGYGTSYFDGMTFADLQSVSFVATNVGGAWMPYMNIWITNGAANPADRRWAVIANEPSNAPLNNLLTYDPILYPDGRGYLSNGETVAVNFSDMSYYVHESNGDTSWLTGLFGGNQISYASLVAGGWKIDNPNPGTAWGGTGAPKNGGYGFNFIYGDTMSNYVSTGPYTISNIVINGNLEAGAVVPIPAAAPLGLLGMGLIGLARKLRKKSS